MHLSVRRFFFASLVVLGSVMFTRPALAQSTPDNAPALLPVLMQNVSFTSESTGPAVLPALQGPPPAQKHHEGIGIGLKGGFMFAGYSGGPTLSFQNKAGVVFMLFLGGNRPGLFGVATEITIIKRTAAAIGTTTANVTQWALEIPFLFRLNFGSKNLDRAQVYFLGGPALDINLQKLAFSQLTKNTGYDLNIVLAGGVEITRFILEVRYNKGLRAIANDLSASINVKTHSVMALFGIRFN